ncbi:phosphotriesterase-related protein-like [Lingula anatina]|uniref:Phosphotriesterase-related protein-like n=1 Tax=Lingula anatina TaxID=7574 RepID=A0A1S3H3U8_LINAN|nr:phosphotriesterase-related protein-like [Lingula anatina]|eukprot:XP_013380141.1 phosphotriesterase-related protein-like [Lingula anatina]
MIFNDDATHSAILEETITFKRLGGGTIVENTTGDMLRNVEFMKKLSEETDVHIVAGTGFYLESVHPKGMDTFKVEDIVEMMKMDFLVGCDGTDIKCGVIGEIGCSWPLHVNEKKCLLATGEAQAELGCPVIIHPGRHSQSPAEVVRILQEAGGNAEHTVMSHLDRTFHNDEELLEFAGLRTYLEYDHFGIEIADWQCDPTIDMPNDGERIRRIKKLFANGFNKVVIAHDLHAKHMLNIDAFMPSTFAAT